MNLPEMLRSTEFFVEYRHAGYYTELHIGPELAALVEAADSVRKWTATCTPPCECPDCMAAEDYDVARADLVAKIGGKG